MTIPTLVTTAQQLSDAYSLRCEVFVAEQGVNSENEIDEIDDDPSTVHSVLYNQNDECVATGRIVVSQSDGSIHLGRIAVTESARGTGAGRQIMEFLERYAFEKLATDGILRLHLSVQVQAIGFYEKLGYVVDGPEYLDEGIPHRDSHKTITSVADIAPPL